MQKRDEVFTTALGVGIATGLYGISFGALSVAAGLTIWQTQLLSILMFSGGSQFAFIGVIATGGVSSLPAAITSAWLLGVRNGFYAIRLVPLLEHFGLKKLIGAQLTIDESTAVATAQEEQHLSKRGFWLTGGFVFLFWNTLTFAGALLGNAIGDTTTWGLDAAAAAAFLGLLWPRLRERQALVVAIAALVVATVCSPFLPAGAPTLVAGLVAVLIGLTNWFADRSSEVNA